MGRAAAERRPVLIVVTLIPAGEPKVERNHPPLTPEEIAEQNEVILDAEGA